MSVQQLKRGKERVLIECSFASTQTSERSTLLNCMLKTSGHEMNLIRKKRVNKVRMKWEEVERIKVWNRTWKRD